jgi:ATP-dependent DNA helicase RecG
MAGYFDTKIDFIRGVGPAKAALLNKELSIFTYRDLLQHYPFRHEDRSRIYTISEVNEGLPYVQFRARIIGFAWKGEGRKRRLTAQAKDHTGTIELVWFKGHATIMRVIKPGAVYMIFGKAAKFGAGYSIAHPEMEADSPSLQHRSALQPVYSTTEKLKSRYLDSKALAGIIQSLLPQALPQIRETLPVELIERYKLIAKSEAVLHKHFPQSPEMLKKADLRLKFEELFFLQLRILKLKLGRNEKSRSKVMGQTAYLKDFYDQHLPFELTGAQKRVVKEIYQDLKSGTQMNRLLQGDVGSGKTIVAFLTMLIALSNGAQVCLMAPTEILANQHYEGLSPLAESMGLSIHLLTGSVKGKKRQEIFEGLEQGTVDILVGTHAIIEDKVAFKELGLAIIDEQHRFGVAQRGRLWKKNTNYPPHILVMTATPIPRTLAMTVYGDLDVSIIDELPKGRKPIQTFHKYDSQRLWVFGFMKQQIEAGRQVYVVYPLIEESEQLDLKFLFDGLESLERAFPGLPISLVHGRQKSEDKDFDMQRFVKGETKIMAATTVIEVGVNVPNASVMVIENAERFGLAQLHQLRGRVGRGAEQSYCILMTSHKLTKEAKLRIDTMVRTNDGFEIAETDLRLRGPGDIQGTKQSGLLDLLVADLSKDARLLQEARVCAQEILDKDPHLEAPEHRGIRLQIEKQHKNDLDWSRIS